MHTNDTGRLMKQIYACMNSDSKNATGIVSFQQQVDNLLVGDISSFRGFVYPARCQAPAYVFKWSYQLENLCKRFRFEQDAFTDAELEGKLFDAFQSTQCRLSPSIDASCTTRRVIGEARSLLRRILGRYDQSECQKFSRFGKNAAVGVPKAKGLLHLRLARPLTGSQPHLKLFNQDFLESDQLLKEAICQTQKKGNVQLRRCDCLKLSCVPKSYKAFRGIMPNTEVGNFLTSGLSKYLESKLYMCGISLAKSAEKHKKFAKEFSKTRTHVTADLSAASDSFTSSLVNALLPRDWYNAIKTGRIDQYTWKGKQFYMQSFMTMGIGFTFPLQTLLFYGLLKAIAELTNVRGDISVYGDDLIYPVALHKYVVGIFDDLGFQLNKEKTYATGNFRESCGSDFYRGVDVRPFSPEGCEENLSPSRYAAFCYKLLNGINRRWDPVCYDLNRTRNLLLKEILRVKTCIYRVPMSYPDTSGMKTDMLHAPRSEWFVPYAKIFWDTRLYLYRFPFLQATTRTRIVDHHVAYLWDWLRAHDERVSPEIPDLRTPDRAILPRYIAYETAQDMLGQQLSELSVFKWETTPYVKRDPVTGRRIRRRVATVAEKLCEPWYVETLSYSKDNPPMSA